MAKTNPAPPFLELNFYFSHRNPIDLTDFVLGLLDIGARLSGVAYIQRGQALASQPFDSIHTHEGEWEPVNLESAAEFIALRDTPDVRPVQVPMWEATGVGGAEIVTYLRRRPKPYSQDRAPIAIWTSGDTFWGTEARGTQAIARRDGRIIYKRFIELVKRFDPDYGSISFEWGLETPSELATRSSTFSFHNCYLSKAIVEGLTIPKNAYVEVLPNGMYISGYEYFNPKGKSVTHPELDQFSGDVAKKIARLFRKG
jgi:hypothetical protein